MKKQQLISLASLLLLVGCSPVNTKREPSQPSLPEEETTCYDAITQMLSQDGYTRTAGSMRWTRGEDQKGVQVVIDFEQQRVQLNQLPESEELLTDSFDSEKEYQEYIDTHFVLFKYDAAKDQFYDFTMGMEKVPEFSPQEIEDELRTIYETYTSTSTLLGCESIDALPWRRFEKLKEQISNPFPDLPAALESKPLKTQPEPIDLHPQFIEVSSIHDALEFAQEKYIPAYEKIAKTTRILSYKPVNVDVLVIQAERVNELPDETEVTPKSVLNYIQDYYFEHAQYAGDYLLFIRVDDKGMDKVREELRELSLDFEVDNTFNLFTITANDNGNCYIKSNRVDSASILSFLNDSLEMEAAPEDQLEQYRGINEEWNQLFALKNSE